MVLSACSPYFKALLEENPAKHPIIILKDVPFQHLTAILEFMYAGEVDVAQDQLPAFLKTAERLKVKGLVEAPQTRIRKIYLLTFIRVPPTLKKKELNLSYVFSRKYITINGDL